MKYLLLLPALLLAAASCSDKSGRKAADEAVPTAFSADSLHWADSITLGKATGSVSLTAYYPESGSPELIDSLRGWVARHLLVSPSDYNKTTLTPDSALLADGKTLLADAGKELIDVCRQDFAGFDSAGMTYPVAYEFDYQIKPIYQTATTVTYNSMRYTYMAGAHGSTVSDAQTFRLSDGLGLTASDMFLPDSIKAVTELVKKAVYEQYFLPQAGEEGGAPASFKDCLLIDPADMTLPAYPPYFMPDGVVFVYQQYEIACYAAGMPACVIPYSTLLPSMTPMAATLVKGFASPAAPSTR